MRCVLLAAALGSLLMPNEASAQIVLNQTDTFQDGTTNAWSNGGPATDPVNIATGGPAGAGDRYLEIATNGNAGGSGSRMVVFNRTQWLGNYIAAGVSAISFDVKNIGGDPLSVRVGFKNATFNGAPGYVSAVPAVISADGNWHHVVFPLDLSPGGLVAVGSPPPLANFFTNGVAEMRLLHATGPDLNGSTTFPNIQRMGIDNILATAVPEPGTLGMLVIAATATLWRRGRC